MTAAEIKLNRIEENLLSHWDYLLGFCEDKEDLTDEDRARFKIEMELFTDSILPTEPTEGWAFWTDYNYIYTESETLAERLADVIDFFADAHTGRFDPEELLAQFDGKPCFYVNWD